jgi:hypothetical protein
VAFAALRRARPLALLLLTILLAGPATAPLAAQPTPDAARACAVACGTAYAACAAERCDSGSMDRDPACLAACRSEHRTCLEACS